MTQKKLTGRIAADRIRMHSTPKPPVGIARESIPVLQHISGLKPTESNDRSPVGFNRLIALARELIPA